MSTFKKCMADDLDVFINADEFAEMHDINQKQILAVVEGLTTKEQIISKGKGRVNFDGVYEKTVILHCRADDLGDLPARGNVIDLDGTVYIVADSVDDFGMVTITLEVSDVV